LKILEPAVYLGPNLYALFPVIRLTVDLGNLEEWPSARLGTGFTGALLEILPGLHQHSCSYGEPGGFVRRLTEEQGTWLGHVLEHLAIELQNVAGAQVTFGKTRSTGDPGCYNVIYEYEQEEVGLAAGRLGVDLLHSLLPAALRPAEVDPGFDFAAARDAFIRYAQERALGPSTAALVRAARERGIPCLRLNRYNLVQLGHGRYGKKVQATVTSKTRNIAVEIASDKRETHDLLADLGLPVPSQRLVDEPEAAVAAAADVGFPVVVKPLDANHGRGVSIELHDPEAVRSAFGEALEHSQGVLVESFIEGFDHRLLVVDGRLIAAAKRVPGHVVGDGSSTVEELVAAVNLDPRRGIGHEKVLTRLELDSQAERLLALRGYHRATVPAAGEVIYLRATANLSTGGTAVDVTDRVHPDNREMAHRAAVAIGLDVAGIDFITTDVSRSYREIGGGICEVNAAPGFRMHVAPSEGEPRDVAGPVIDMLFPPGTPSRIPLAAVTGTNGKTTTTRMVAHVFKLAGHRVGVATTDGVYIDGHLTVEGDMTGPAAARMVLRDPAVDAAVLETARGGLLRRGMGYRQADVGAVLNVQADHLGRRGIETVDQLAAVKRIVVEVAKNTAVLNADDPFCLKMADHTHADHLCYVTMDPKHALVREHIRAGGRAVVLEEGMNGHLVAIYDRGSHIPLLWSHEIPATLEGRALHNVQNAMFAAGITFSMGIRLEEIRHGLRTFDTTFFQSPGRMNVFDEHPFKVILDYGHNPAAVAAMVQLVERLDVDGRRLVVLTTPGDRRDEDVRAIARLCAGKFDRYVCHRDDDARGRGDDEIPRMLRDELLAEGVPGERIEVVPEETRAVQRALETAAAGDLLLIFCDAVRRSWQQITGFVPGAAPAPAESRPPAVRLEPPELPAFEWRGGEKLIRDQRGVRLARESED
jgi:cyanophycin synthetase